MNKQEFDEYAKNYKEVLNQSIGFSGEDSSYFAEYKIRDLHHELALRVIDTSSNLRLMDFGCGVGASIPYLRQYFPNSELVGVDVSEESLQLARNLNGRHATFLKLFEKGLPTEVEALDAAYAMCVFHHIDETEHVELLTNIRSRLKPNGLMMIYEHNPLNPLTVRIVNQCPFDANAKLIAAKLMAQRCQMAGFTDVLVKYRVFFPGFLRMFRFAEGLLTWLPLGGQYYVRCLA
jgi:SAM-dependent methyltransferase